MTPSPGDDRGWKEFQERYVMPLWDKGARLQGVLCDVRQLIIDMGGKGSGASAGRGDDDDTPLKTPSGTAPPKKAWQAYYVRESLGITNQTKIAEEMTEQGTPATQGQVSKWLTAVDSWLKAGGIKPTMEELHEQPKSINPAKLEMGARQDGRTPSQRDKMTDPADDWD